MLTLDAYAAPSELLVEAGNEQPAMLPVEEPPSPVGQHNPAVNHAPSGGHGPDDPAASEHGALIALMPVSHATHLALQGGDWSDPMTWAGGSVPQAGGRVYIPSGLDVRYEAFSETPLDWIRVDGTLRFAHDRDTHLRVETLAVMPGGRLEVGTQQQPILAGVTAEIEIDNDGPIDRHWDPSQLSRGLVSHGSVSIVGSPKTAYVQLARDPRAGDVLLELAEAPGGWRVGDQLVLTGTGLTPGSPQDELLVVTSVDGPLIGVDRPLVFDHATPRGDLKAYVGNLTRNVRLHSRDSGAVAAERGHVMFMHNPDVRVWYAEFFDLGRTDKSVPLDDFLLDANGYRVLDAEGDPLPGAGHNIRGRYPLHLHRVGTDVSMNPVEVVGNVVRDSPGWGMVQHDSRAVLADNVVYNAFGAAFMAETGNETGVWTGNLAVASPGAPGAGEKEGSRNQDTARNGSGFWLQGRLIEVRGNVAAGTGANGFVYFVRGVDQLLIHPDDLLIPQVASYQDEIDANSPPIRGFADNEAFGVLTAFKVIKERKEQHHDLRSLIERFTAWEVDTGIHVEYTSKYTFTDLDLTSSNAYARPDGQPSKGIDLNQNTEDLVVNRAEVSGFDVGVFLRKLSVGSPVPADWLYAFIDVDVSDNAVPYHNRDDRDRILTGADLVPIEPTLSLGAGADTVFSPNLDDRYARVAGTKVDSLGPTHYLADDTARLDWLSFKNRLSEGHYRYATGERFLLFEVFVSDRATGAYRIEGVPILLDPSWETYQPSSILASSPFLGFVAEPYVPSPGDFNRDGRIDAADINLLFAADGLADLRFDLDGDGVVVGRPGSTSAPTDLDYLILGLLNTNYGDSNLDGAVDLLDLSMMSASFGQASVWEQCDFNGDGVTSVEDLSLISSTFGQRLR